MTKYTITALPDTLLVQKNGRFFTTFKRIWRWHSVNSCERFFEGASWTASRFEEDLSFGLHDAVERFNARAKAGDKFILCTK